MLEQYIEERAQRYYVQGSRITVASLAYAWDDGRSPETIAQDFPTLKLSQVYAAIAFYLDHKKEIDAYRAADEATFDADRAAQRAADPQRYADIERRFTAIKARNQASAS